MAIALSATVKQTSVEGTVKLTKGRDRLNVVVVHQLVVISVILALIRRKRQKKNLHILFFH